MVEKIVNIRVNEIGVDSAISNTDKLADNLNEVEKSSLSVKQGMKESTNSVLENGGAMGLLNDATGGLAMTVKDAVEATALFAKESKIATFIQGAYTAVVGTSTGAMKAFKIALIGTGVGALVVGLGLLIANFGKIKEAVLGLFPGLATIGKFFGDLVDTVTDFVGITSDATRELDRLGEEANKTLEKNKFFLEAYGDKYDEYTKRKIEANTKYAEQVKSINEDEELGEAEKLRRLKILRETANREILKAETDRQKALAEKRKEEAEKLAEAEKKRQDEAEKRAKEAYDKKIERIKKEGQAEFDKNEQIREAEENIANWRLEQDLKKDEYTINRDALELERIKTQYDQEVEALRIAEEAKAEVRAIGFANIESIGQSLQVLAGKNKALAKAGLIIENASGIAKIIINTQVAATKSMSTFPGPVGIAFAAVNYVSGALSVAASLKATATAMKELGGGSAGSAPSIPNGGTGSASTAPQFNIVGQNSNNQLAQSIGAQQQRPIEAFVVSGNVTTGQQADRNRIKTATFGA